MKQEVREEGALDYDRTSIMVLLAVRGVGPTGKSNEEVKCGVDKSV